MHILWFDNALDFSFVILDLLEVKFLIFSFKFLLEIKFLDFSFIYSFSGYFYVSIKYTFFFKLKNIER